MASLDDQADTIKSHLHSCVDAIDNRGQVEVPVGVGLVDVFPQRPLHILIGSFVLYIIKMTWGVKCLAQGHGHVDRGARIQTTNPSVKE